MKIAPFAVVLVFLLSGCMNRIEELERQNSTLQSANSQLLEDVASRDATVDAVTDAISSITAGMEEVRDKEVALLTQTADMESARMLTREEIRGALVDRITLVRGALQNERERIAVLESRLASSARQHEGLRAMIEHLRESLENRDLSIASLGKRIARLKNDLRTTARLLARSDSLVDADRRQASMAYYVAGTRGDLERKGIIRKEGGFLWGLLGSSTALGSSIDQTCFTPIDRDSSRAIRIAGTIDEIVPGRERGSYAERSIDGNQSMLTIARPSEFWQVKYLVIITDRGTSN